MILWKKLVIACFSCFICQSICASLSNAEENAANLYLKAGSMLTKLPEDFHIKVAMLIKEGWLKVESKELEEIVAKNQEVINIFKQATKIKDCDFTFGKPIVQDFSAPSPYATMEILALARLILIEAKLYEEGDKLDLALEDYLSILRLAKHLDQQENFILISKMTGIIIEKLLYTPLANYIKQNENLNIENCQLLLNILLSLKRDKLRIILADAYEEERKTMIKLLDSPEFNFRFDEESVKNKPKLKLIKKVRQAIYKEYDKLENELYPYFITAFRTNDCSTYKEKSRQLRTIKVTPFMSFVSAYPRVLENKLFQWIFSSAIAKTYSQLTIMDYSSIIVSHYISMSKLNILITAVAVQFYELKNAKTLDDLQDLVPAYLEKIPEDPFDNFRPLKYEKKDTEWFVYSFGPDKQDDHGSIVYNEEETKDNKGDIVFSSF